MRYRLAGGAVVFPDGRMAPGVVDVVDGRIERVFQTGEAPVSAVQETDVTGFTVAPGFVDIHVNGGGGETFEVATPEGMSKILATSARYGATSLVGTLNTATNAARTASLERLRAWRPGEADLVELLGVYLEGPYYHPEQRGAHPAEWMHDPDPNEYLPWLDRFGELIRVFSLAPERDGSMALIRELARRKIVAAVGHSSADEAVMDRAIAAGARLVTHHYCAQSTFHRAGADKHLGVAEVGLMRDDLTVEVIPDGKHLPPVLLDLILKLKPHDRICVVTDAMQAAGLGPGEYRIMGTTVWVDEEVAYRADRQRYAGSILTMDRAVRNLTQAGVLLADALKMATSVPARTIGLDDRKGRLAPGYDADLVLLDGKLAVDATVCRGRVAYARGNSPLRAIETDN